MGGILGFVDYYFGLVILFWAGGIFLNRGGIFLNGGICVVVFCILGIFLLLLSTGDISVFNFIFA